MDGAGKYKNKTPPKRGRNEENCAQSRGVVVVPVVVEPVVVPVPLLAVEVEVTDVEVVVGVTISCVRPSKPPSVEAKSDLRIVSYSGSKIP